MVQALWACPKVSSYANNPNNNGDSILHFMLHTPAFRFENSKSQIVEFLQLWWRSPGAGPAVRDLVGPGYSQRGGTNVVGDCRVYYQNTSVGEPKKWLAQGKEAPQWEGKWQDGRGKMSEDR